MLAFLLLLPLASATAIVQTDLIDGHYKYKVYQSLSKPIILRHANPGRTRGRNRRLLWLMGDPCRGGRPVQSGALRRGVGAQPGGLRVLSARPEKEPRSKRRESHIKARVDLARSCPQAQPRRLHDGGQREHRWAKHHPDHLSGGGPAGH